VSISEEELTRLRDGTPERSVAPRAGLPRSLAEYAAAMAGTLAAAEILTECYPGGANAVQTEFFTTGA